MKNFLNAIVVMIAFHSINVSSQDIEEVVVITSALVDTSEITNPLYVIDGEDIVDDATTSLGDAIDSYLGVSIADYGAAVGQRRVRNKAANIRRATQRRNTWDEEAPQELLCNKAALEPIS